MLVCIISTRKKYIARIHFHGGDLHLLYIIWILNKKNNRVGTLIKKAICFYIEWILNKLDNQSVSKECPVNSYIRQKPVSRSFKQWLICISYRIDGLVGFYHRIYKIIVQNFETEISGISQLLVRSFSLYINFQKHLGVFIFWKC